MARRQAERGSPADGGEDGGKGLARVGAGAVEEKVRDEFGEAVWAGQVQQVAIEKGELVKAVHGGAVRAAGRSSD